MNIDLKKYLCSCLFMFLLNGCTYYPISKQYRDNAADVPSFTVIKENPDNFKGKTVIWGGEIISTSIDSQGSQIMVLQAPLDDNEKPGSVMGSQGRFLAVSPSFLDPEIFKNGRKVTMAGTVIGAKVLLLDKLKYKYPVIHLRQIHIWSRTPNYYYYPGNYWWRDGRYWGDGFDDEFGDEFYEDFDDENGPEGDGPEGDGHEGDGHEGDGHEGDGHEGNK